MPKSSTRVAQLRKPAHSFRAALAACLLLASAAPQAQTAPAVSTIVAFNGSVPSGSPILGSDGALYGTSTANTVVSGGIVYRSTTDGSSVTTLHQFQGSEGSAPAAGLLKGSDGLLYGSTLRGAATEANSSGTIYSLAEDGSGFTILHRFQSWTSTTSGGSPINADGATPEAALIEGSDGLLYGATRAGGAYGAGVVFRMSRDGTSFTVLHEFISVTVNNTVTYPQGLGPAGSLLQAPDGYLYGVAQLGGASNTGTIYRLQMDGADFEVLHDFAAVSASDGVNVGGAAPLVGLTNGQDGFLYGVASVGGASAAGTLFSLDPNSLQFVVLHDFEAPNGSKPAGALIVASDTMLYGTTANGGTNSSGTTTNFGTIYSIARDGTGFTKHLSFDGSNGSAPGGALLPLDASTFVGVTASGGTCGQGTLFSFSTTGATVTGNTTCGQKKKNKSGGGGVEPFAILMLGAMGLARRRRRH